MNELKVACANNEGVGGVLPLALKNPDDAFPAVVEVAEAVVEMKALEEEEPEPEPIAEEVGLESEGFKNDIEGEPGGREEGFER